MTLPVRHYYHVYAAGAWAVPVREHVAALAGAGLRAPVTVGLAGPADARADAREAIGKALADAGLPAVMRWAEADEGWEQVTLREVHTGVHAIPGEYAVLYAHTKGAHDASPVNAAWRRTMTRELVGGHGRCARLLAAGCDAVGCHWVTAPHDLATGFYAGNFWMAKASYLRRLPPPADGTRWEAETWVSSCSGPVVADLLPGWPRYE